ncbi:MAG: adenylyltransferase/cytidyltransferase family protein [Lachnospiraceae bacterium]|nr:adenylyltransferase/cytidyltransferase family protein [Lachnospiraceae bacterium]
MKKYKKGYTQGVYDMFHIGHLNILNRAKEMCDYLVVGINSDVLVQSYKSKTPIINENDRMEIVRNIKAVDEVVLAETLDKREQHDKIGFDAIFIGSDWKGNPRWEATKQEMQEIGVDVVFLPHTDGVTSTMLRNVKDAKVDG